MHELGIAEKILISTYIAYQNIPLIKILKFMPELEVDTKIHTPTPIAFQNIS